MSKSKEPVKIGWFDRVIVNGIDLPYYINVDEGTVSIRTGCKRSQVYEVGYLVGKHFAGRPQIIVSDNAESTQRREAKMFPTVPRDPFRKLFA